MSAWLYRREGRTLYNSRSRNGSSLVEVDLYELTLFRSTAHRPQERVPSGQSRPPSPPLRSGSCRFAARLGRVVTYEARGVVVPDRLGVTEGLEKGRRLEDLLLDLRVLAGTCGEELQDELRRLRFARTGLTTRDHIQQHRSSAKSVKSGVN